MITEERTEELAESIEDNPIAVEFLENCMIDDLHAVKGILSALNCLHEGISLEDYRDIQKIVEKVHEY